MNPVIILIIILILGNPSGLKRPFRMQPKFPPPFRSAYIDTFKMELLLDRLHTMTNAIEKINHLNQIQKVPAGKNKGPSIDRIQESLEVIKGFLAEGKHSRQVDTLSNTLSGVKKFGNMEDLMAKMGPIISMMNSSSEK